jgi:hypothetical protein
MSMIDDGERSAVVNEKNEHYAAMPMTWQAKNNRDMNEGYKYNDMSDAANVAHPPTPVHAQKNNRQVGPEAESNSYNYNANRS